MYLYEEQQHTCYRSGINGKTICKGPDCKALIKPQCYLIRKFPNLNFFKNIVIKISAIYFINTGALRNKFYTNIFSTHIIPESTISPLGYFEDQNKGGQTECRHIIFIM
jgi:hypothetical protein